MRSFHAPSIPRQAPEGRQFGRLRCQSLMSTFGPVVDLSGGGMRIRTGMSREVFEGADLEVMLNPDGPDRILLAARVVWVRKVGWRTREAGLMFLEMDADTRTALGEIARRLMRPDPLAELSRRAA